MAIPSARETSHQSEKSDRIDDIGICRGLEIVRILEAIDIIRLSSLNFRIANFSLGSKAAFLTHVL